jgi:hypothetical protein
VGYHSLTPRGRGPAASLARPALPPGVPSALLPWSPRMKLPGWRGHRHPVSELGAASPAARALTRYGEPAGQHEGGEGSPGRWLDGGVVESSSVDGVRWRWSWHGGHQGPWCDPIAWRRRSMSRGAVGCERSKFRAKLNDEGGQWSCSGRNRRGPAPLVRHRWTWHRGE